MTAVDGPHPTAGRIGAMPDATAVLPGYAHVYSGKVRDLYAPVDPSTGQPRADRLLLVASDRISAYDFVLDTAIPDKGEVLTRLSLWWFAQLEDLVANHVVTADVPDAVRGRAVLVERLDMLPVECVARAYLTGEPESVGGWVVHCARAVELGAREGLAVCEALQRGE